LRKQEKQKGMIYKRDLCTRALRSKRSLSKTSCKRSKERTKSRSNKELLMSERHNLKDKSKRRSKRRGECRKRKSAIHLMCASKWRSESLQESALSNKRESKRTQS
jgi:hypothetical protein